MDISEYQSRAQEAGTYPGARRGDNLGRVQSIGVFRSHTEGARLLETDEEGPAYSVVMYQRLKRYVDGYSGLLEGEVFDE